MIVLVVLGQEAGNFARMTSHLVADELVNVDSVEECLTNAIVVEGSLQRVEHKERLVEALDVLNGSASSGKLVGVGVGNVLHNLNRGLLQRGGTGGFVELDEPLHLVGGSLMLAVVVGVGQEVNLAAVVAIDGVVHPRARADGLGLQIVLGEALRENLNDGQTTLEQALEGVLQREGNSGVVLLGNGIDEGKERTVGGVGHVELERVHDVGSGNSGAVGELSAVAKSNFVLSVGDLDRLVSSQGIVGLVGVQVEVIQALENMPGGSKHQSRAVANGVHVGGRVRASAGQRAALSRSRGGAGSALGASVASAAATSKAQANGGSSHSGASNERAAIEVKRVFHDPPFRKGTADAQPSKQSIEAPTAHIGDRASKARAKFKTRTLPEPSTDASLPMRNALPSSSRRVEYPKFEAFQAWVNDL